MAEADFRELLWSLWAKQKRQSRRPSEVLAIDYPWVADDLDDAVAVFGQHVETKCREASDQVIADWRASETRRQENARGRKVKPTPMPRRQAGDAAESAWYAIVKLVKHRRLAGRVKKGSHGMPRPTAILTWEKPLTGDPFRDASWDDAKIVAEEPLE